MKVLVIRLLIYYRLIMSSIWIFCEIYLFLFDDYFLYFFGSWFSLIISLQVKDLWLLNDLRNLRLLSVYNILILFLLYNHLAYDLSLSSFSIFTFNIFLLNNLLYDFFLRHCVIIASLFLNYFSLAFSF